MTSNVPEHFQVRDYFRELAASQDGVVSRRQVLQCGFSRDFVAWRLRTGRWQKLAPGVYSVFTGAPPREAVLWAALLRAGPGAALSHHTAAELSGLTSRVSSTVHVTIPASRRFTATAGIVAYRSGRLAVAVHPSLRPPRTRIEETVLDLVAVAETFDAAFGVVTASCQRQLTTTGRLAEAMGQRKKLRWRDEVTEALGDISNGVHSLLEYRYVHLVERPHRLPAAVRQVPLAGDGRSRYLDNLYRDYRLCVELDGEQAHPDDQRWQDLRRINEITTRGITTLRYGWTDINIRPCQTAGQVARVLRGHGWSGTPRRCAPGCVAAFPAP
jgi:hypothetical protein